MPMKAAVMTGARRLLKMASLMLPETRPPNTAAIGMATDANVKQIVARFTSSTSDSADAMPMPTIAKRTPTVEKVTAKRRSAVHDEMRSMTFFSWRMPTMTTMLATSAEQLMSVIVGPRATGSAWWTLAKNFGNQSSVPLRTKPIIIDDNAMIHMV